MRFKLLGAFAILLIVGSNDARPSIHGIPEVVEEKASTKIVADDSSSLRPLEPTSSSVAKTDSRSESTGDKRKSKDLQYMDQSLRTVATQLLNVTSHDEPKDTRENHKVTKINNVPSQVLLFNKKNENSVSSSVTNNEKSDMDLVREINSEISSMGSMGMNFGRPVNSKFAFFESSHPGQAMAMTEEELERELMAASSTRLMTAHKNHPTTTGGISTWILLNPPTTTSTPMVDDENNLVKEVKVKVHSQNKVMTPVAILESVTKTDAKTATTLEKVVTTQSTTPMERVTTLTKSTTSGLKKTTLRPAPTTEKPFKTPQPTLKIEKVKVTQTTFEPKTSTAGSTTTKQDNVATTPKATVTTKKTGSASRPTTRPRITTPKPMNVTSKPMTTKLSKPQSVKPTRRTTSKTPVETTKNPNTSKIEKVTFRPVHMITTPKSMENVERPMFVSKIKSSIQLDSSLKTPLDSQSSSTNDTTSKSEVTKSNTSASQQEDVPSKTKKPPVKANNVLKVQLKKPTESSTSIEIEPIKVSAPILKIEKIAEKSSRKNSTKPYDSVLMDNSPIDVKFDFNPEAMNVDVETPADAVSVTTKRPHKRKKNKVRRRKPTTVAPSSTTTLSTTAAPTTQSALPTTTPTENVENLTELGIVDNFIQESKIVAESKVSPSNGASNTKNKKKQVQKPIGTQIYNFLSREVMPSFGVMSLVGLGLGLASYFLYPFGGAIARRNYVVEPNYKYSMDEYGGNYGQNEEEVFSKVLQGMTNQDGKYGGIKDYENNFYRYQQAYDGAYDVSSHTTRRDPTRYSTSSALLYRPLETTNYDSNKYRNTEFKYPEVSSTPNYYERQKKPDFVGKHSGDRQFVVGNVPKEYAYEDNFPSTLPITTESPRKNYEQDNFKFSKSPTNDSPNYAHAEALKSSDDYDELEITPSAVAVEHGPRSLKTVSPKLRRRKRESVIQLIPSRTEIEKEVEEIEKEEPLSNEILDIIDSVIPGDTDPPVKSVKKSHELHENEKKHNVEKKASGDDAIDKQAGSSSEKIGTSSVTDLGNTIDKVEVTEKSVVTESVGITQQSRVTEKNATSPIASSETAEIGTTTAVPDLTIDELSGTSTQSSEKNPEGSSTEWLEPSTTPKPHEESFNVFNFIKKVAEVKLRLGVAILKHASEGLARYLGHVQKRINGEE